MTDAARRPARDGREYGDFQTPRALADLALRVLTTRHGIRPDTVVEPSCGVGAFLLAAAEACPGARVLGFDIDGSHVDEARRVASAAGSRVAVKALDFFDGDWTAILGAARGELLLTGNPPWVTSSELGSIGSTNLPAKSNFAGARGIDAITGSSNFDLSEYMLLQYVKWLRDRAGTIAVLCKTSVARKSFRHAATLWPDGVLATLYSIDAARHFDAAVDACFLVLEKSPGAAECRLYPGLDARRPVHTYGLRDGVLVKDVDTYDDLSHLIGRSEDHVWRSGIKHDCSKVMELDPDGDALRNGFGDRVRLEPEFVFPLLKSSDIANGRVHEARKRVIVTQRRVGEDTSPIRRRAPRTWRYLTRHADRLDARTGTVYRAKPRFSVFGVGGYAFRPWKVAISGMYKSLAFRVVPPLEGKPVMTDDTVYFLPCESGFEAVYLHALLTSEDATALLEALIFWDEKRPVTSRILRLLDLERLAWADDSWPVYRRLLEARSTFRPEARPDTAGPQLELDAV